MDESSYAIDGALNLIQRSNVKDIEKNINDISILLTGTSTTNEDDEESNAYIETFLQNVDQPLQETTIDTTTTKKGKKFIPSEYNQVQNSFRSPWSNTFFPPLQQKNNNDDEEDTNTNNNYGPSPSLRQLEIQANEIFDSYKQLYYGRDTTSDTSNSNSTIDNNKNESVSSVYFWDKDSSQSIPMTPTRQRGGSNSISRSSGGTTSGGTTMTFDVNEPFMRKGFNGCFLIKKTISDNDDDNDDNGGMIVQNGSLNSIHHVDFGPVSHGKCKYTLSSTVLVSLDLCIQTVTTTSSSSGGQQNINISGSLSKELDKMLPVKVSTDHISNIGKMIEDVEIELRTNLDSLYIQKTKEIFDSIRPSGVMNDDFAFRSSRRSGIAGAGGRGFGGVPMPGMMMGLPAATQNEMNAALMARFKKVGPS